MLVLSRKIGEAIVIDGNIVVRVLGCNGCVRIGIEAPHHIPVDRSEVDERVRTDGRVRDLPRH